jgi:ribosomal protein L24E
MIDYQARCEECHKEFISIAKELGSVFRFCSEKCEKKYNKRKDNLPVRCDLK